jgi:hypothetical protein
MEKQQIRQAYLDGMENDYEFTSEEYYNETFKPE